MKSTKNENVRKYESTKSQFITTVLCIMLLSPLLFLGEGLGVRCVAQVANGTGAGNCLSYDGTSDYVEVADNSSLNFGTGDFSVAFWYKNTAQRIEGLVGKKQACNGINMWNIRCSNVTIFNAPFSIVLETWENDPPTIGGYVINSAGSNSIISSGNWVHIAAKRKSDSLFIYINGVLDNKAKTSGIANVSNTASFKVSKDACIGVDGTYYYSGQIDELSIWNRSLTETEIQTNMCQKLTGSESGLVGYWRFDEGSGGTAYDASPKGNNGTLY